MLIGAADVRFSDKRVETTRQLSMLAPIARRRGRRRLGRRRRRSISRCRIWNRNLQTAPSLLSCRLLRPKPKTTTSGKRILQIGSTADKELELLKSPRLEQSSNPGESERDFRVRLQQHAREQRDAAVEKLRQKYAPKIAALEERRRRSEQAVERESEQA